MAVGANGHKPHLYEKLWTPNELYPIGYSFICFYGGYILGHSGVARKLYDTLYLMFARTRGGLAAATVIIGAIVAACVGVIGASIAILTVLALPSMLEKI